jgi:hypothetical protein
MEHYAIRRAERLAPACSATRGGRARGVLAGPPAPRCTTRDRPACGVGLGLRLACSPGSPATRALRMRSIGGVIGRFSG